MPPDASAEQIREGYRTLARLLHPDQQTDPALRLAAESQMRRINQRYAVLGDAERRKRYDAELAQGVPRNAPIIIHSLQPAKRMTVPLSAVAWTVAALASSGLIVWLSSQGQGNASRPEPATFGEAAARETREAPPVFGERASETIEQLKRELRIAQAERDSALRRRSSNEAVPREETPAPPRLPEWATATSAVAQAAPEVKASVMAERASVPPLAAPRASTPIQPGFAGFWVYLPPKNREREAASYPPVFIETKITERNGQLHGRYRSRYHVYDRAISPDVNFEFDGKAAGDSGTMRWRGEAGSWGEVEIRLVSANEMELRWVAKEQAASLALASGSALLMRRPD